ncbi:efflux RND transporter permease subunit [uncultured Desulfobacter sp.]|uniref:efflux RND transporter permease subunit n=1 Tax=uncultured Desulfobacter sp. TaxID=240139 RepID=UPI0029F53DD8|nr:efflux RND transporter permease subunit [uncultured Desulfobacter sp.]
MSAGYSALKEEDQDDVYTGTAAVSWELDLCRKLADSAKAASKDVQEQQMLFQSARDTLASEIMTEWLELTSAKKNISIEQKRIDVLEKTENYTMQRYRSGLGTLEDLDTARTATASARATIATLYSTGQDDISRTVAGAKKVVGQFRKSGSLPDNVTLTSWYDRSTTIIERLELLAMFLNLTVAFWGAIGLPFIFFGTLYFMGDSFAGLSLNEFTTFGFMMALGIVVDDAVAVPTLFGVFTTVAAFYAISQVSGHMGELYSQFAIVVTICLVLSVIESKLILPSHLAPLNTRQTPGKNPIKRGWMWVQKITDQSLNQVNERIYGPLIKIALHHRYAVLVVFAGIFIFVLSMPLTGMVRMNFFPDIPGDTVRAELTMKNDASYGQTHAALALLESKAHEADRELRYAKDHDNSAIGYLQVLSEADQSGL